MQSVICQLVSGKRNKGAVRKKAEKEKQLEKYYISKDNFLARFQSVNHLLRSDLAQQFKIRLNSAMFRWLHDSLLTFR